MRRLLILHLLLLAVHCYCPDGFDLERDGICTGNYGKLTSFHDTILDETIAICTNIGNHPVYIHDQDQYKYWSDLKATTGNIVIGLKCNSSSTKWEWTDGSALDFKPPTGSYNIHLDDACKTGCSWYIRSSDKFWTEYCDHDSVTADIFCTGALQQTVPSADGCDSFEDDSDDGVCYRIGATAENFQEAQIICRSFGGDLASIHNLKENSFIRRLAVSKGQLEGLFLGATVSGKGNDFGWIDGSEWDYDNFYPGFPIDGAGSCVVMDTEGTSGLWANTNCSAKYSVACERQNNFVEPACTAGPWKEEQIVTILQFSFPFNASTPCDFLLTVGTGKRVEVEILLLEANSCCDHLVLFEDYLGGNVVANLTGAINDKIFTTVSSNYMRVSWQPNGGVNVRGMMITFRGV